MIGILSLAGLFTTERGRGSELPHTKWPWQLCYQIWMERNARIFRQKSSDSGALISVIIASVRDRLSSWDKSPNTSENNALCCSWNISSFVLSRNRD